MFSGGLSTRKTSRSESARLALRRAFWTFATQGLFSASNFILTILVLATEPARPFAVFSLVLTTYLLIAQFTRWVVGIPVLIGQSRTPDEHAPVPSADGPIASPTIAVAGSPAQTDSELDLRNEAEGSTGLSLAIGLAAVPALASVGLAFPEPRSLFLILTVALPFLLLHDTLRHVAIARGRPQAAAAADGAWLAIQLVSSAVAVATGAASASVLFGLWAGAGSVSSLLLARVLDVRPKVRQTAGWLRAHALLCRRVAVEFVATSGSFYAISYALAAIAGAEQLGYFRAAQTLFGPATVLLLGGLTFGVPESVRVRHQAHLLLRFALRLSVGLSALSLACGATLYVLLPVVGPRLFPDSWEAIRNVIPWLTLFGASIGAGAGPTAGLRALDESRWILHARAITGALALVVALPATAAHGASGALAGLAAAECVLALRGWLRLRRNLSSVAGGHAQRTSTAHLPEGESRWPDVPLSSG